MNKFLISLLILTSGFVKADYTIITPIEEDKGGYLPSKSILFQTTNQENPVNANCKYIADESYWASRDSDGNTVQIRWENNLVVFFGIPNAQSINSYTSDGYIYTRGELRIPQYTSLASRYEVCREPLN